MKPIISVEGLGKKYTIRHEGQGRYRALREEIFKLPQRLFQRKHQDKEEFWALRDISFDIMPGDRVGMIGRNGAGKSTLLKLLSRITEPSTGKITLRGRVASLLEVGTGFHPELTGRENIFLNGAILGMSRTEVHRKFDEIVDFAGVEKFLDTPVKRYSSGMYVRLAFAVAAHLEPEILIVDEVLAVGDAEFQKKCLGKMEQVGQQGRTVLFVSHNMAAVSALCTRGIILSNGTCIFQSDANKCIDYYSNNKLNQYIWENSTKEKNEYIIPYYMDIINNDNVPLTSITFSQAAFLRFRIEIVSEIANIDIFYKIVNSEGIVVYDGNILESPIHFSLGKWEIITELPTSVLNKGTYYIYLCSTLRNTKWIFNESNGPIIKIEIKPGEQYKNYWLLGKKCILASPTLTWKYKRI